MCDTEAGGPPAAPRRPQEGPAGRALLPRGLCPPPHPPRLPSAPPDSDSVPPAPAPHNGPRLWRLRTEASLSVALGGTLEPGLLPQS